MPTARPDPSANADIAALVSGQNGAAQRFIATQIANIAQRLDVLNRGDAGMRSSGASAERDLRALPVGRWNGLKPETAAARSAAAPATPRRVGVGAEPNAAAGPQTGRGGQSALSYGSTDASAGLDYRLSSRVAVGVGGGYGRGANDLTNGHDQGLRARSSDIAAYGSLRAGDGGFVDVLLGAGTMRFETRRLDAGTSSVARGVRNGDDRFASVMAGHRFFAGRLQVAPWAGVAVTAATLHGYTETGAGGNSLAFGDQRVRNVAASLGVRGEYRLAPSLGAVAPRFAAEYDRRFSGDRVAPLWYVDNPRTTFAVPVRAGGSRTLLLSIGGTAQLQHGFLFNLDYRTVLDHDTVEHALRVGLSTAL
ncbi:MAG: hypothetical protein NVS3B7_19000 [Candidatus Elarobacter sp.]